MTNKEKFIQIFKENIKREGSGELLSWLEKTDFFTAPASTKFHLCEEGGLCEHSINVYECLAERHGNEHSAESIAIVSLLHDLCKAQFYKMSMRNQKNEQTGQWERVPYYQVEDKFPFGHGEKSVFLIERFMRLKVEEAIAIRWHMGGFDDTAKSGGFTISNAFEMYPLAVKLHIADIEATYLREGEKKPSMF